MGDSFFFSHSGRDRDLARRLAEGLQRAGLSVWCDQLAGKIPPGQPWTLALEKGLEQSSGFLLLVPADASVSGWVQAEVHYALNRQARDEGFLVVPLLVPGVEPEKMSPFLQRFQGIRLRPEPATWDAAYFDEVVAQLNDGHGSRFAPEPSPVNPFPGLEAFDEHNAQYFFGREKEVVELCRLLGKSSDGRYRRWLQIDGPSGAGKSSVARAGLIPAVRRGWIQGAVKDWTIIVMRPGRDPVLNLATKLAREFTASGRQLSVDQAHTRLLGGGDALRNLVREFLPEGHGFFILVDQMEEVFTLSEGTGRSSALFEALLAEGIGDADLPFHLVTTIRTDFVVRFPELPRLEAALNGQASRYYLERMSIEALGETVERPLKMAGARWEEGLPARIVNDAAAIDGGLPCLSHVLHALWERRSGAEITHAAYQALGGLTGSLAQVADELMARLGEVDRRRALDLLAALVRVGRGSPDTRRAVPKDGALVLLGGGDAAERLLARLSGGREPSAPVDSPAPPRLVTVSADRVDLVHDSLLLNWGTLRDLVKARRIVLEKRDELEQAVDLWEAGGKAPEALSRGGQLERFESVPAEMRSARAAEFLTRARELSREEEAKRRIAERRKRAIPILASFLVLIAAALSIAIWLYLAADRNRQTAEKATKAAEEAKGIAEKANLEAAAANQRALDIQNGALAESLAQIPGREIDALRKGLDAVARAVLGDGEPHPQALAGLDAAVTAAWRSMPLRGHTDSVVDATFSPDSKLVATASKDKTARIWNAEDGRLLLNLSAHTEGVRKAFIAPNGKRAITIGFDDTARLWELEGGTEIPGSRLSNPLFLEPSFSPGGSSVAILRTNRVSIWDIETGKTLKTIEGGSFAALFTSDGGALVTASRNSIVVHDVKGGFKILRTFKGQSIESVGLSPNGTSMLMVDGQGVSIWSLAEPGRPLWRFSVPSDVSSASYFPDGESVLVVGKASAQVWSPPYSSALRVIQGHTGGIVGASFSQDGGQILTCGKDSSVRVWTKAGHPLWAIQGASEEHSAMFSHIFPKAAFSPDGTKVVTVGGNGEARIWRFGDGKALWAVPLGGANRVLAFSPNDALLLVKNGEKSVTLLRSLDGSSLRTIQHDEEVITASFTHQGRNVVTSSEDKVVRIFDAKDGKPVAKTQRHQEDPSFEVSPDDRLLATVSEADPLRIWDAASGSLQGDLGEPSKSPRLPKFAPNGSIVATFGGGKDYGFKIWNTTARTIVASSDGSQGHSSLIWDADFSPDGSKLVTASLDASVKLWSSNDGKQLLKIPLLKGAALARFLGGNDRILAATQDGKGGIFDARDGRSILQFEVQIPQIFGATVTTDQRRVLVTSMSGRAQVFRVEDGTLISTIRSSVQQELRNLGERPPISSDGQRVAMAESDGSIRMYTLSREFLVDRAVRLLKNQPEGKDLPPEYDRFLLKISEPSP